MERLQFDFILLEAPPPALAIWLKIWLCKYISWAMYLMILQTVLTTLLYVSILNVNLSAHALLQWGAEAGVWEGGLFQRHAGSGAGTRGAQRACAGEHRRAVCGGPGGLPAGPGHRPQHPGTSMDRLGALDMNSTTRNTQMFFPFSLHVPFL